MMAKQHRNAELDELHADLARLSAAEGDAPSTDKPDWVEDVDKVAREWHAKLAEASEDVEDVVRAHPLAAISAALLLGIIIGRVMGRAQ